jgi:hypothetical protein
MAVATRLARGDVALVRRDERFVTREVHRALVAPWLVALRSALAREGGRHSPDALHFAADLPAEADVMFARLPGQFGAESVGLVEVDQNREAPDAIGRA